MNFGDFLDSHSHNTSAAAAAGGATVAAGSPIYTTKNGIFDSGNPSTTDMPSAAAPPPLHHPFSGKTTFNSSGLSLAIQMGENTHITTAGAVNGRRTRDDDLLYESRSGSDNLDAASGDDPDDSSAAADKPPRKKRYHRHTPQQIQELEAYATSTAHKKIAFLSLSPPHLAHKDCFFISGFLISFSFFQLFLGTFFLQTQLERHENSILRQENDKLRAENLSIREAMRNPICTNCGGPAVIGDLSLEEQHLRIENARLKDELDRVCSLAGKFLGRPVSSLPPPPGLDIQPINPAQPAIPGDEFIGGSVGPAYLELALAAMDELIRMATPDGPLWASDGGREVLDRAEYLRNFSPCLGMRPEGFVSEASRETGMVIINGLALVETLMDSNKWAEMFPCVIARASTTDVICSGMGGSRNGALQLMNAAFQVLSPLVPVRKVDFIRFCKQHSEGVWAVVDVSIDALRENSGGPTFRTCRRLPSGCVVQDMPNGYSKVTWVEHVEYDETTIHHLYRPPVAAGMAFGAHRWLATLQRQCRKSMLKLAQRMTKNFCSGVCFSSVHKWNKLRADNVGPDVQVMTRKSVDDPGEPPGIVLTAATSVWLPVGPQRMFDFLRDERLRSEWDILSNGGPMQEMARIAKGHDHGNCVSLLRAGSSMLILQETCTDASGSLVVYAPVDIPAMHVVMNGGDSAYVALLPSGFSIMPDGLGPGPNSNNSGSGHGSLLTVAFQILVNSLPSAKLTVESVETVNNLISCTVQKIRSALDCEG
ncbi:homeobox-leucine zipper protein HDG1 [Striga asiatica]|uniref:Homeobox-leucine zipper protein HDG1 n=1 Tax=Striga asiatica TaxID=4170 RepID=A0A5A7Q5B6_STRAF|nr:homeobox-leucine zipper protein HDG1 [Striga asiatica]